jgi:hypothetical protein
MQGSRGSRGNVRIIAAISGLVAILLGAVVATQFTGDSTTNEPTEQTDTISEQATEASEKASEDEIVEKVDEWITSLAIRNTERGVRELFADNDNSPDPSVPRLKDVSVRVVSKDEWMTDNHAQEEGMWADWPGVDEENDPIAYTEADITYTYSAGGEQVEGMDTDFDVLLLYDNAAAQFLGEQEALADFLSSANANGPMIDELAVLSRMMEAERLQAAASSHHDIQWDWARVARMLYEPDKHYMLSAMEAMSLGLF